MSIILLLFSLVYFTNTNGYIAGSFNENKLLSSPKDESDCDENISTYCEIVNDYPIKDIELLLSATHFAKYEELFFGVDTDLFSSISPRNGMDDEMEIQMCNYSKITIFPKKALTLTNDWLFIINTDTYKQGILTEQCM